MAIGGSEMRIDEMRERQSCVVRLRESESESRDKREKKKIENEVFIILYK